MIDPLATDPATADRLLRLAKAARRELVEGILPFWLALEDPRGGHWISVDARGRIDRAAPRRLIFAARMAWTLTTAGRRLDDDVLRRAGERAQAHLWRFHDPVGGGFWSALDPRGRPLDRSKHLYGQAFALFALAARALAARDRRAARAMDLFECLEARARRPETGLYLESFDADWAETPNTLVAAGEPIAPHTANTHLHLIEAYGELLAATGAEPVVRALRALLASFTRTFLVAEGTTLLARVDRLGRPLPCASWPGHDIEASHLIEHALDLLPPSADTAASRTLARRLAAGAVAAGMRPDGGWIETTRDGEETPWRVWWVQAEAVLGLLDHGLRTADPIAIERAAATWAFIERHQRDPITGDWHLAVAVDRAGPPDCPRVTEWKDAYHQSRACLEIVERCGAVLGPIDFGPRPRFTPPPVASEGGIAAWLHRPGTAIARLIAARRHR